MGCVYNFFAPRTREKRCKKNSCSSSSHLCSQSSSTSSSPSSRSSSDQDHLADAWSAQISRCENRGINQLSDLSDVQVMQLNALFLVVLSVTMPMAARSLFGPMPFPAAFLATEAFKVIIIKVIKAIIIIFSTIIRIVIIVINNTVD